MGEDDRAEILLHALEDGDLPGGRLADEEAGLRPLVAEQHREHDGDDDDGQADHPGQAAATRAALVLFDQLVEVVLGLRLEVGRAGRRPDGVQAQGGEARGARRGLRLAELQRRGGRAHGERLLQHVAARDVADVQDHGRDVVGGAGVQALLEEPVRHLLRPVLRGEGVLEVVVLDDAAQPVRADQPAVARLRLQDPGVDLGGGVHVAEHAHQHGAARVDHRLLLGDAAAVDEPLDEGVVRGDLLELTVAVEVDARVADVRERDLVADADEGAHGGAHPGELGVLEDGLGEQRVRGDQRGLQRELGLGRGLVLAVRLADPGHGDRAGDVAARVAAHPVGDDEQVPAGIARVLVVRTDLPDVGDGRRAIRCCHGYRRSSNVVVPILIGVSSGTWVGTVTRRPSRNVPLVESRSWIIHSSFHRSRRAWWLEV